MKTSLLALLLLCVCVPAHCDCQQDCLTCRQLMPREMTFNGRMCVLECEGIVSPSLSWDLCHKTSLFPLSSLFTEGSSMMRRAQEEVGSLLPDEQEGVQDNNILYDLTWAVSPAYNTQNALSLEKEREDEVQEKEKEAGVGLGDMPHLSKRFGGFMKGRHGYKKLLSPGRSFQKRYGGFIGVRKSARKWNNQKRFSEFLKQYLGMSARATEVSSVSEDLNQQNVV